MLFLYIIVNVLNYYFN